MYSSCTTGGLEDPDVGQRRMCDLVVRYLFQICLRTKHIINLSENMARDEAKKIFKKK